MDHIDNLRLEWQIAVARREQAFAVWSDALDAECVAELRLLEAEARPATDTRRAWLNAQMRGDTDEMGRLSAHMAPEIHMDRTRRDVEIARELGADLTLAVPPCSGGVHCIPVPGDGIPATVDCQCGAHRIEVHDCEYSGRPVVYGCDAIEPSEYDRAHAVNGG